MNAVSGFRMKRPAHPGGFVRHEIIEPLELSVTAAAAALGGDAGDAFDASERARQPFAGDGASHRKGVRHVDRHLDADAEQLRHRPDARPGGRDQGPRFAGKPLNPPATAI